MKKQVLLIGLLLISFTNANAQLLGKLKKAKDQATKTVETVDAGKEVVKGAKKKLGNVSGGLKLDWTTFKQTPAVTFNSLLYGTSGGRIDNYTATFIPNKTVSGKTVDHITDQAEYLKIKVYKDGHTKTILNIQEIKFLTTERKQNSTHRKVVINVMANGLDGQNRL